MSAPRRDPQTGTWWFVVDLPASGNGKRRQAKRRGFPTKRAAQVALDRLRVNVREGTHVAIDRMTLGEYLDQWGETLAVAGRKPATVASYRRNLRVHVHPRLGAIRLQELTPLHLDTMYAELLAGGNMRTEGAALSPRTVRYVHTILRKALADATRKGLIVRNPSDAATPPSAKAARAPEMAFWTPAELHRFLRANEQDDMFPMLRLVAMSGLRRGEACGLRWSDVDLDDGTVDVRRQLVVVAGGDGGHDAVMQATTKSDAGRRRIDLDDTTVAVLRTHRASQAQRRLLMGSAWTDSGLVFTRETGEQLDPDQVSSRFETRVKRFDGPRLRFHDLRHTHCAHLIGAGVNVKTISRRLGHASVSFTLDRYGHLMPEADGEAAAAVAALVDGVSA